MLIRIGGGIDGIKEYLEEGKKEGREKTRDELDERVILEGDLELTDKIIQAIDADRECYLHITLAFKEDDISQETMRKICTEFRNFAMAASREDEYNFYAEAHYPKIKSYVHAKTGELVERKPHIHVVIPRINVLTGKDLNPFDLVERQTKWLSAFQEHVNNKYGLASPQDNRRYSFTNESEMIARYKGDFFEGNNHDLRGQILADVLARGITHYEDFTALLAGYGAVRTRNAGRPGEYLNVKPAGAAKGVNLKDAVFSREFIEKPTEEKHRLLTSEIQRKYETAGRQRSTDAELLATVQEWREVRALEVKFLHTDSKFYKQTYLPADDDTKRQLLAELAADYYRKHGEPHHARPVPKSHAIEIGRNPPPGARGRLRSLSELGLVRHEGAEQNRSSEVLLSGDVPGQLEHDRADNHHPLRRSSTRPRGGNDSVTGQLAAELEEGKTQKQAGALSEFAEIRRNLDARRLLDYLSKTHGLVLEKYEITKGKDGSDRIHCGRRNLNVSDFLTREMRLSFTEAAPILRGCYAAQRGHTPHQPRSNRSALWNDYQAWRQIRATRRATDWELLRENATARRAELKRQYYTDKGRLQGDRSLSAAERKAALSLARMQRIEAEKQLRETIKAEREALRVKYQGKPADIYRDFLTETVEGQGATAEKALAELRRMDSDAAEKQTDDEQNIKPETVATVAELEPIERALSYRVARNGDVTYQVRGKDALTDEGQKVLVLRQDQDTIETGLRLAVMKFGNKLTLTGADKFKRSVVAIAVEKGIRVQFVDPVLEAYRRTLEEQRPARFAGNEAPTPGATPRGLNTPSSELPAQSPGSVLVAHGAAKYMHEEDSTMSYFVTTRDAAGSETTFWGVDLKRAIETSGAEIGDTVSVKNEGYQTVLVNIPVRNEKGRVVGHEEKEVQRNTWNVQLISSVSPREPSPEGQSPNVPPVVAPSSPAELPGEVVIAHSAAKYMHDENNTKSYFVTTRDNAGRERTYWGVDLERAMEESAARLGDRIIATNDGYKNVTVKVPVKDESGKVVRYEEKEVQRNTWSVQVVDTALPHEPNPRGQSPIVPPVVVPIAPAEPLGDVVVAHGAAKYMHDDKNTMSYFVTTTNDAGHERTYWGVDLERAMEESAARSGDRIIVTNKGNKNVTVKVPVKDSSGRVVRQEEKEVKRNIWDVEVTKRQPIPSIPNSKPADKEAWIYKGEVHSVDTHFVYQQTKEGMVYHHREQFAELPRTGDNLAITYLKGRVVRVKDRDVDHGMGL